jgi:tetratricopeptide (TPR) repeat protein
MSTRPIAPDSKDLRRLWARLSGWWWPTWTYRFCAVMVLVSAVFLCFVPLFNLVGYESAAFFGVLSGLLGTGLTLHAYRVGLVEAPLAVDRARSPGWDFVRLFVRHMVLVAVPLVVLSANAFRVPNCDWTAGLGFWLLIPPMSLAIGQTLAWLALSLSVRRRLLHFGVAFGLAAMSAGWLLWHLATQPPIVGFQWWLGYFGGSIYDEALAIDPALAHYRLLNLGMIASIVGAIEVVWWRRQGRSVSAVASAVLLLTLVTAWGWANRQDKGIDIDRDHVIAALGGTVETEHFIIHYPAREPYVTQLPWLIEDHEYRYAELKAFFRTDPVKSSGRKVRSFVYADRDSKGRLMGARNTLVAKLWLNEMHILWRGVGDHVLAHELAHIFTEPFGAGPLRLSMQYGVGVNMGLVEGIATAADWPAAELTPHEASAALRQRGLAPDIRRLVSASGFWTQASGRAYTLMGSFVRYLVDTYGIEAFKKAYGRGQFLGAYGKTPDALVTEWEAFLDAIELTDRQVEVARYLYDRPSIFGKVCARTIAELWRQSQVAASSGDLATARALYERILSHDPTNFAYHLGYARILMHAGAMEEALGVVRGQERAELEPVRQAELWAMIGDLKWHLDRLPEARRAYGQCLELGVPIDVERSLNIKQAAVGIEDEAVRRLAYHYLLDLRGQELSSFFVMEWVRRHPDSAEANYLVGRRLWDAGHWPWAIAFLEQAEGRLGAEILDAEALRMLGQSYYFVDRLEEAERRFERLRSHEITRYREEAREWLERIRWKRDWNRGLARGG